MAKILVVEDNPANMKLAVFLLDNAGHQVLQARDSETALGLARSERPDLILMDIQLPGVDGLTATRQLKRDSATCAIKILAVTGNVANASEEAILAAGCSGYIFKPIQHDTFLARIDQALNES